MSVGSIALLFQQNYFFNIHPERCTSPKAYVEAQIKSTKEFAESIGSTSVITPLKFSINKISIEKIDSLPLEKTINAFAVNSSGNNDKNYMMTFNLVNQFSFLNSIDLRLEVIYSDYIGHFNKLTLDWNSHFLRFDSLIAEETVRIGKDTKDSNYLFHREVRSIANKWYVANKKGDVIYMNDHLIEPLIKLASQELKEHKNNYAFKLDEVLTDMDLILIQWKSSVDEFQKTFNSLADNVSKGFKKLQEAQQHFKNNSRTVSVYKIK